MSITTRTILHQTKGTFLFISPVRLRADSSPLRLSPSVPYLPLFPLLPFISQPPSKYATTLRNIVPLPDRRNPSLTYPDSDYTPGTQVMALYPDTTSFYRAVIVGGPVVIGGGKQVGFGRGLREESRADLESNEQTKKDKDKPAAYRLKFEDDDDTVREVAIELVVELP